MRIRTTIIASLFALGASLTATTGASAQVTSTRTISGPQGKSANVVTTIDGDRSDGSVGAQRTITGPGGRTASRSRSTHEEDGTIVHDASRTGFDGQTASKQDVYSRGGSTHTRTGRLGRSRTWSRSR
jgi:hypothetical protein